MPRPDDRIVAGASFEARGAVAEAIVVLIARPWVTPGRVATPSAMG